MTDEALTFQVRAKDLATGTVRKVHAEVSGLSGAATKVRNSFIGASAAGQLIEDATQRVAQAFGEGIRSAVNFQRAMLDVQSVSKLSATDFKNQTQQVLDLSTQLPQSAEDLSKGLYDIASSGFQGADGMTVLNAAAKAASAGLATTHDSAAGLTAVLNAYHLTAGDAAAISDIMFKTVDRGVVTFDELASQIGTTTALASPLGVSFEEVSAALSVMTRNGIDAANATTQINAIMGSILKPTTQATALAKQLGLEWDAEGLKANGLAGTLTEMQKATHGNHEQQAILLGDARAIRGAMVLASDGGAQFNAELKIMQDAGGSTSEALGIQSQGLAFQIDLLTNQFQAVTDKIVLEAAPALTSIVKVAGGVVTAVLPLVEKLLPALGLWMGFKLVQSVSSYVAAMTAAKAATLGFAGIVGVGVLAGEQWGGAINDMITKEIEHRIATEQGAEALKVFNDALLASGGDVGQAKTALDDWNTAQKQAKATTTAMHGSYVSKWTNMADTTVLMGGRIASVTEATTSAMAGAVDKAEKHIGLKAGQITDDLVQSLVDAQSPWKAGWDQLKNVMATSLSQQDEIAKIQSRLSSSRLKNALHDERPAVRLEAEKYTKELRDRLWALTHDVDGYAARTGMAYPDALKAKRAAARTAARNLRLTVTGELDFDATPQGRHLVDTFIAGITEHLRGSSVSVGKALQIFMGTTFGNSPPKSGPLMPHKVLGLGRELVTTYISGVQSALRAGSGGVQDALDGLLPANMGAAPRLTPALAGAIGSAGASGAGTARTELHVHFHSLTTPSPAQGAELARTLLPELERERRRQGKAR